MSAALITLLLLGLGAAALVGPLLASIILAVQLNRRTQDQREHDRPLPQPAKSALG
jgi:hypothetical protein